MDGKVSRAQARYCLLTYWRAYYHTDSLTYHHKAAKHGERVGNQNFSVVDPVQYSERFQKFVADALV